LPIIETLAGDFSAYIPTNVVSITDGQIYLQTDLFFSGQRPAVNVGISVSRVGGAAQTKAMKRVAGSLRINLAQYRDLEVFAQFGSDLDKTTRDKLIQGERLLETLKQPIYSPFSVADQVITLYVASGRALMDIQLPDVSRFNTQLREYMHEKHADLVKRIRESGKITEEDENIIDGAVTEFKSTWK
jgi:F-type H+-transporting ATPase subunit alpha